MNKIEMIKEIYQLDEHDETMRKEALEKLVPYADEIMDKFYEKLLEKEEFRAFIPVERIPELKEKQIAFVAALLSMPFDEKLYNKIAHVGVVHYHIRLDPLYMSYGYHLLSELILAQSKRDASLLPYLKLIIKYLKVSESIMGEEYFAQKRLEHSPYRGNDLFIAVNELHIAYISCRKHLDAVASNAEAEPDPALKTTFEKHLDTLKPYRDILTDAGFNIAAIRRYCTEFYHATDKESRKRAADALRNAILKPMNDLSVTAYLGLGSSLSALRAMTDIVYQRSVIKSAEIDQNHIMETIRTILGDTYGWAIASLDFLDEEPDEERCDILKHLYFPQEERIVYLCISLRPISNRIYITEGIDLLAETMKLTLFLRAKEA